MSAPHIHAKNSVRRWGGVAEDYIDIHAKMDCSKAYIADNRHRALTHNMFWVMEVMIPLYGITIQNSDDKTVSVKDICEKHILEDLKNNFFKEWIKISTYLPSSIKTIGFPAYTPYFNDGDPCEYEVHIDSDYYRINSEYHLYDLKEYQDVNFEPIEKFLGVLPYEFWREFEEGIITINREGSISVDYYEHD